MSALVHSPPPVSEFLLANYEGLFLGPKGPRHPLPTPQDGC